MMFYCQFAQTLSEAEDILPLAAEVPELGSLSDEQQFDR